MNLEHILWLFLCFSVLGWVLETTLAAIRTMDQPEVIAKAREELKQKNGGSYHCPLPDYVTPPIGRY